MFLILKLYLNWIICVFLLYLYTLVLLSFLKFCGHSFSSKSAPCFWNIIKSTTNNAFCVKWWIKWRQPFCFCSLHIAAANWSQCEQNTIIAESQIKLFISTFGFYHVPFPWKGRGQHTHEGYLTWALIGQNKFAVQAYRDWTTV